jgi:hypothetical protein
MDKGSWGRESLTQIGVALGYVLAFSAIHWLNAAAAHWHLYAGLQLIALLMIPYRYWGALLIGEAVPNAYFAWVCLPDFGIAWVAIRMVPEMLLSMPIVWLCQRKLNIFPTRHLVNIKTLLICIFLVSIVLSAYSFALISTLHITEGPYRPRPLIAAIYLSGNYAGLLTLVPWALIIRLDHRKGRVLAQLKRAASSRLVADAIGVAIPVIILMGILAAYVPDGPTQLIEMGMLIPAAWLTFKHGWRAAALTGTAVIFCNGVLQPGTPTPEPAEMMSALCVAITALYALGAKVSAQKLRDARDRLAAEEVQGMARHQLLLTERRMRQAAEKLEFVAGSLHIANSQVLQHMRRLLPEIEKHGFFRLAVKAHEQVYELAESLHPQAWRDRGLPAALNETLARALDEAGVSYRCEISGRGFLSLEAGLHTAIYRTACESIVYVTSNLTCSSVKLVVRAGETNKRRWVAVRVVGNLDANDVARSVYFRERRRDIAAKLGANLNSVGEMRAHAQAFDGALHVRSSEYSLMVTALLHSNSAGVQKEKQSAPLRLWVN